MRQAWYAVTAATVLNTACIGPTATGVRGIATLGGTPTDQLAFPVQPSGAVSGQIITPAVQVAALDSLGNTDLTFTGAVTVSSAGTGYTLVASAPPSGAKSATSKAFDITSP